MTGQGPTVEINGYFLLQWNNHKHLKRNPPVEQALWRAGGEKS